MKQEIKTKRKKLRECFRDNLNRLMGERNMRQKELADILGVDKQYVSRWCCGVHCPRPEIMDKLADIFDCSVSELFK